MGDACRGWRARSAVPFPASPDPWGVVVMLVVRVVWVLESTLPKCNAEEGRGGEAKAQHKTHTEHYSKLPVYFTSVLYIPLYGTLVP